MKVLMVDDDPGLCTLFRLQSDRLGFEADLAKSGHDGIRKVLSNTYRFVLMDIQLSGLNGLETTRILRLLESGTGRRRTPVVVISAGDAVRQECLAAGADDFISKPLLLDDLRHIATQWDDR